MGKLTTFEIVLANPQNVYFAGQWIQGHVTVNISEPLKMRGMTLTMLGAANVHWSERHSTGSGKNRRTTTRHYRSNECYFNNEVLLFGHGGGMFSGSTPHPAGNYSYPFQMQLPQHLPSSFEGAHGNVRYYIKCTIDRPWKFDHKTKAVFTVIANLDLNTLGAIMRPLRGENSKTLCCLCCASGPIEASVSVDRGGFVPGENILINAVINNGSSRSISSTKAELVMITSFHATSKSRSASKIVAVRKSEEIEGGGNLVWNNEPLHIPPVPPSDLVGCRIIDIRYYINFVVDPSGPARDMEIQLPITIGTIPLRNYFQDYSAAAAAAGYTPPVSSYVSPTAPVHPPPPAGGYPGADPAYPPPAAPGPAFPAPGAPGSAFPAPGAPGPAFPGYSAPGMPPSAPLLPPGAPAGAPPPSYQECVFGRVDTREEDENEHTMGNKSFAPSYTYYNWNNTGYTLPEQKPEAAEN